MNAEEAIRRINAVRPGDLLVFHSAGAEIKIRMIGPLYSIEAAGLVTLFEKAAPGTIANSVCLTTEGTCRAYIRNIEGWVE